MTKTVTTVTKTCDLCGKVVQEFYKEAWQRDIHTHDLCVFIRLGSHHSDTDCLDLCKECNTELLSWIEQKQGEKDAKNND